MSVKYIAIAAMARNRIIGNEGKIPWYLPEDWKHFKETTSGHPIIMGRKTFESIGKPLPGRENIVLTRGDFSYEGVRVFHTLEEIDAYLKNSEYGLLCSSQGQEIIAYVCGGSQIYEEYFRAGKTDEVILSVIDMEPEGDAAFPYFEEQFTKKSQDQREGFTIEYWIRGDHPHMNPYTHD